MRHMPDLQQLINKASTLGIALNGDGEIVLRWVPAYGYPGSPGAHPSRWLAMSGHVTSHGKDTDKEAVEELIQYLVAAI